MWEKRTSTPLLPLWVALDRNRGGSYLVFLFVGAGLFAMFLFMTFYFQITMGYTPLESGFALPPVQPRCHRRSRIRVQPAATHRPDADHDPGDWP